MCLLDARHIRQLYGVREKLVTEFSFLGEPFSFYLWCQSPITLLESTAKSYSSSHFNILIRF